MGKLKINHSSRIMKLIFALVICSFTGLITGQNIIEWDSNYKLKLSDFLSKATQVGHGNIYSIQSGSNFDFSFSMTRAEFFFTRNFNPKVNCTFNKNAAVIVAPDSLTAICLLSFAQYEFDLSELYARKFRARMFEEKKVFSDARFYKPIYDQIQREFTERNTTAGVQSDLGRNKDKLKELHQAVLEEIDNLADYCKICIPKKQK